METISLKSTFLESLNEEEFAHFCSENRDLRIENDFEGYIIIRPPKYSNLGIINSWIIYRLFTWNKVKKTGVVFASSTGFTLSTEPKKAVRSADVAWIKKERWESLTDKQKKSFAPICPDFIIELKSHSDSVDDLKYKIENEWIASGCQLAWLIDLDEECVYIFRQNGETAVVQGFNQKISGENILPGFELDLNELKTN